MVEPAMIDRLIIGTVQYVEINVNDLKVFQNYELLFTLTSGIFCSFGRPGSQDNTSLLELLLSL